MTSSFDVCQLCNEHAPAHLDQQMLQFQFVNNQQYWYFPTKRWSFRRMTVLWMTCSTLLVLQHSSQYVHMDCDSKSLLTSPFKCLGVTRLLHLLFVKIVLSDFLWYSCIVFGHRWQIWAINYN